MSHLAKEGYLNNGSPIIITYCNKKVGKHWKVTLYFYTVYNILLLLKSQYIDEAIHWKVFMEHMNVYSCIRNTGS